MSFTSRVKIEDLINNGSILVHKDGNHGAKYPRTEEFGEVGVPFLTAKLLDSSGNIDLLNAPRLATEKAKKFTFGFVQTEDVLLSHNATVGRVAVMPQVAEPILIGTSLTHFRLDKSKILPTYLAAYFSGKDFQDQLAAVMSQTTRNQVPITSQRKLYIELPSIDIQTEIVKHIDSIDNKIRLNNQINQTLESIAQAIFKSWFINFEPVRAKIAAKQEGKDPELAALCAISGKSEAELEQMAEDDFAELQATAALFPDELVESELGEVPKGWVVEKLSQNIDVLNGYAFKSKAYIKEGIFVLRTKNFNNGLVEGLADDVYLPKIFLEEYPNYICEPYDYHMVMVGASIGDTGLIFPSMLPALRNQNMWCFRAKNSSDFGKSYTKLLLDSLIYETLGFASGSAREFFRKGDFQDKRVCVPSKKLLRRFEK